MRLHYLSFITAIMLVCTSCSNERNTLFIDLDSDRTGIDFRNLLIEDEQLNVAHYIYFYNGAGVAIGDINNDRLQDVFFTGNMVKNRLYLNKGNFAFENITDKSGVAEKQGWCTGTSMVDINQDGYLDIYVCRSADDDPAKRKNLLFINNKDLSFSEEAEKYGLADNGYSTQATFFDYDRDGDLDCFVLNHSVSKYSVGVTENPEMRSVKNPDYASRLYRNDNNKFNNVSDSAGITSNVLSFGLGVALSDFNNDGWTDIYVSNDFKEPDYLFMNNGDGTFKESFEQCMDIGSLNSMGSDAADYNNDGLTDLVTLDMLAEDNYLQKTHAGPHNFDKTTFLINKGFQPQYMRNMLQKNNGDGTFSEVGQIAGISNTDWSWSALFSDFDLDGRKDLFISNGFVKDFSDLDFIAYSTDKLMKRNRGENHVSFKETVAKMPTIKIPNYIYKNTSGSIFENATKEWGLDKPVVSSGAAYADLDNDGDMDLVINNSNDRASVYRNNAEKLSNNNYLRVRLEGSGKNLNGIGAKVSLYTKDTLYYQEQFPVRGYQSSVDIILNFGIGKTDVVDSLLIVWPDGRFQLQKMVKANQEIVLRATDASGQYQFRKFTGTPLFEPARIGNFVHSENNFNDFTVQTLLLNFLSREGPCIVAADVNNDQLDDLFVGGAKGKPAQLLLQKVDGTLYKMKQPDIEKDSAFEDVAAVFFDANNDGNPDLFVGSGGYEFNENDPLLQDRIYFNDGKGNFRRNVDALPQIFTSTSCVKETDIDDDGDLDLFVGSRVVPGRYPLAAPSKVLINNGRGIFSEATQTKAVLETLGMVTDALWIDVDRDNFKDLVVIGEWMSIHIFRNSKGTLQNVSSKYLDGSTSGWWNTIVSSDFDKDGDEDIVIGNSGTNMQFKSTVKEPATLYYKDFDGNGSIDPLFCYYIQGKSHPAASRDDLLEQMPSLKKKFNEYSTYASATIDKIFSAEQLKDASMLKAEMLSTVYLQNDNDSGFTISPLPVEAQYAPVHAIAVVDVNSDGYNDLLLAGNTKWTRVQFGRHLSNHGSVLLGNGKGQFRFVPQYKTGLNIKGEVRSIANLKTREGNILVAGINDAPLAAYKVK